MNQQIFSKDDVHVEIITSPESDFVFAKVFNISEQLAKNVAKQASEKFGEDYVTVMEISRNDDEGNPQLYAHSFTFKKCIDVGDIEEFLESVL